MMKNQNLIKFFLLFLAFFFTRGTIVGDEEKIYLFANEYLISEKNLINYLKSASGKCELYDKCNYNYLGHHLVWFFYQIFFIKISNFFYFLFSFLPIRFYHEFVLSLVSTFFVILSIYVLSIKFKKIENSFVYIFIFFFGSYGIGFINGGFIECFIIFLISLKIYYSGEKNNILIIAFLDTLLIYTKIYFLLLIFLYLFIYNFKASKLIKYILLLSLLTGVLFYFKIIIPIDYASYYQEGLDVHFYNIIERIFFFYFSPSVGVVMSVPLLFLAIIKIKKNNLIKILIFFLYSCFFSFYGDLAFWGGAGIGGSRYIFPILILFLEEFIYFMRSINKKIQILLIISLFLIHLPNINYKNTNFLLVPEQTGLLIVNEVNKYPLDDFNFSPLYFSLKIFYEINFNKQKKDIVVEFENKNFSINKYNIMPDSFISKLVYVTNESLFFKSNQFYKYKNLKNEINRYKKYNNIIEIFSFFIFGIFIFLFIYLVLISISIKDVSKKNKN